VAGRGNLPFVCTLDYGNTVQESDVLYIYKLLTKTGQEIMEVIASETTWQCTQNWLRVPSVAMLGLVFFIMCSFAMYLLQEIKHVLMVKCRQSLLIYVNLKPLIIFI
jgi:hypothetical protein